MSQTSATLISLRPRLPSEANMDNSENQKVTWFAAFNILLNGKSDAIGKYRGWKSIALWLAIVAPLVIPFVQGDYLAMLSGEIPPHTPVIRAQGNFVQMTHGQASWIAFVTADGQMYAMQRGTSIKGADNMPQEIPPPTVYAEGFLLQNGKGYFWPTLIKMQDGHFLTTPSQSIALLARERQRNLNLLIAECALFVCLSIASFFSIAKIKRNLTLGE